MELSGVQEVVKGWMDIEATSWSRELQDNRVNVELSNEK